jgi:hypothetical protein
MHIREERVTRTMEEKGITALQAIDFERSRSAINGAIRLDPRHTDHRFDGDTVCPIFAANLRAIAMQNLGLN